MYMYMHMYMHMYRYMLTLIATCTYMHSIIAFGFITFEFHTTFFSFLV